jgi:hypothetical protein
VSGTTFAAWRKSSSSSISRQQREVIRVPAGVDGAQAAEVEEEGKTLQPRHPHPVPLAGRILVIRKVVERALVHRLVLVAVVEEPFLLPARGVVAHGVEFVVTHQHPGAAAVVHALSGVEGGMDAAAVDFSHAGHPPGFGWPGVATGWGLTS